jgi:hypothetical protein
MMLVTCNIQNNSVVAVYNFYYAKSNYTRFVGIYDVSILNFRCLAYACNWL